MLIIRDLHKGYTTGVGRLSVLKGIDLILNSGDVFTVVGPSGAGKSTLLHVIGGLDKPDQGQVIFQDKDVYRLKDPEVARIRNRNFGFIFQFYHLLPEFTALENVMLPALVRGKLGMDEVRAKSRALLQRVGLKDRFTHKPHQLSGGEHQRVAIARALINEPDIIFCDEPTGNLDSETGQDIIELLLSLNRENRQTLVIVTHDVSIAQRSHRITYMRDGRLEAFQPDGKNKKQLLTGTTKK